MFVEVTNEAGITVGGFEGDGIVPNVGDRIEFPGRGEQTLWEVKKRKFVSEARGEVRTVLQAAAVKD